MGAWARHIEIPISHKGMIWSAFSLSLFAYESLHKCVLSESKILFGICSRFWKTFALQFWFDFEIIL